ncbi:tRNA N6-adenosine threonylcarbamoyltransferase, mitochondrial-like [Lineus longissimus]|uniref:tRNA N6-adenosine threonylcarbamoyltransferase, mitochondrial-like n=1 Tax=Lineus longissimus TaxID=88925 RepID=UPI00315CA47E
MGEAIHNQTKTHVQMGGIIPPLARDLHVQNIKGVVDTAMERAGMTLEDLDAIAATVKPGLLPSLRVGLNHARELVRESRKPFIPIHHMEAHALTVRMIENVEFPFLVLLISGGHCLLAVARGVDDFLLLGQSLDDAPGDAFDKVARRLKLRNIPEFESVSGGQAIETLAKLGNVEAVPFVAVMGRNRNCDFSFSGLKAKYKRLIESEEIRQGVAGGSILPNAADICASFQFHVLHHLSKRLQRALIFTEMNGYLPVEKTLVVSGGVASNGFLRQGLEKMCSHYNCRLVCPPPKLCTDNGIMIAWNGMEKLKLGIGMQDIDSVDVLGKSQLGEDISHEVEKATIKLRSVKLL